MIKQHTDNWLYSTTHYSSSEFGFHYLVISMSCSFVTGAFHWSTMPFTCPMPTTPTTTGGGYTKPADMRGEKQNIGRIIYLLLQSSSLSSISWSLSWLKLPANPETYEIGTNIRKICKNRDIPEFLMHITTVCPRKKYNQTFRINNFQSIT